MKLIVGLGNPGKEYKKTRHNIGFRVLDSICENWELRKKFKAEISKQGEVIYMKPQTFMNLSGSAISAVAEYFKIAIEDILIIYDDKDLLFEDVRFRSSGSAGGHKGALSTIQYLNTEEIARLKIGIAPTDPDVQMQETADYVLSKFSKEEEKKIPDIIKQTQEKIKEFLQ